MDIELLSRILLISILLVCMINEIYQFVRGRSTMNWSRCEAKVLGKGTRTFWHDVGADEQKPTIKYEYRFEGNRYIGRRIKYGDLWTEKFSRPSVNLAGVNSGDSLEVFVNPDHPRQAVLHRGYEGNFIFNMAMFCAVIVAAIYVS
ncbi:MAG: DUF3592 domain-containing protein [Pseudomonadota bacterium]